MIEPIRAGSNRLWPLLPLRFLLFLILLIEPQIDSYFNEIKKRGNRVARSTNPIHNRWNFQVDLCGIKEINYQADYGAWKLVRFYQTYV